MGRVVYFTASSLDGFVADVDHGLDWLHGVPPADDDHAWADFVGPVGALVMGASTYQQVVAREGLLDDPAPWHGWYGDRPAWVFAHRHLPAVPGVDVRFVAGDVRPVHAEVLAAVGDADVWLVGGGDLVGQYADAGLLDTVLVGFTPVTLGEGAPLLPRRLTADRLRFRDARLVGQRVRVHLDVLPAE